MSGWQFDKEEAIAEEAEVVDFQATGSSFASNASSTLKARRDLLKQRKLEQAEATATEEEDID